MTRHAEAISRGFQQKEIQDSAYAYQKEIEGFADQIRKGCLGQRIDYVRVVNHMPLDVILTTYLSARTARSKRRK